MQNNEQKEFLRAIACDDDGDGEYQFEQLCNGLLSQGYTVVASDCTKARWRAILVYKDETVPPEQQK